jgi:hypothetical protein
MGGTRGQYQDKCAGSNQPRASVSTRNLHEFSPLLSATPLESVLQSDAQSTQRQDELRREQRASASGLGYLCCQPLVFSLAQQDLTMGLGHPLTIVMIRYHGGSPLGTSLVAGAFDVYLRLHVLE